MTKNDKVNNWVAWARQLCGPDEVVWINGDGGQLDALRAEALADGTLITLNQEVLPGCYLHRSRINDVARSEDKTFVCTENEIDAGPNNNWQAPSVMRRRLEGLFKGSMAGRTMYVIPFCMGPVGSEFSKLGVQITDSVYVVLSMAIMTRVCADVTKALDAGADFVECLHCTAEFSEENRFVVHFPEQNAIWSINSGYGGNALLGKKCFALRLASWQAKQEGWLAEHMLIIGIENPQGEVNYICAAFPSACGKTNLAMLIPPEVYQKAGYKVWCVGDDIAWLRIGPDGRLWAINPENGFFGVVPGTNSKTNPNALACICKNTIFTNVVQNLEDNTVWWEGLDSEPPSRGLNWKGEPWSGASTEKGAHPNSRFTTSASNCPCISAQFENPQGVPISAFVFGGRRAKTAPLVYQARDFNHGVFVAAAMASETTAAQTGAVGVMRNDPMAMKPFCGYNMGDYFGHWLKMGKKLGSKAPAVFNVNWFRTDDEGEFLWPGFGENLRVLEWILARSTGDAPAICTPIGMMPGPCDINLDGLDDAPNMEELLKVDLDLWKTEAEIIKQNFQIYGDRLPSELWEQLAALENRLNK